MGLGVNDLRGTYDVGLHDFDQDGDLDMLQARCTGTRYWENRTIVCQEDLGFGGPGALQLSACGDDLTKAGSSADLELTGAAPGGAVFLAVGLQANPLPLLGGTLVPNPPLDPVLVFTADGSGQLQLPLTGSGGAVQVFYVQALVLNGLVVEFSNALEIERS